MRTLALRLFAAIALVGAASSQSYVVDVNNGPGTNFTDLATATATVPDGATVVVRAGIYFSAASVTGKGLTIAGEPGAVLWGLTISGQSALQRVVVRGLQFGMIGATAELRIQSCQSAVSIEDCIGTPAPNYGAMRLVVIACPQVSVARCEFRLASTLTVSAVSASDTVFRTNSYTGPAMTVSNCRAELANCTVFGSTSGIDTNGSYVRLSGSTSLAAAGGTAVQGTGTLVTTPAIGSLAVAGGVSVVVVDTGATRSTAAMLGGTVGGTLEGSSGLYGALYFGLVRPPVALPGIGGVLWIEPYDVPIVGVLGTPLGFLVQVPNEPGLRSFTFGWQGVTAGLGGISLSNPVLFSVR